MSDNKSCQQDTHNSLPVYVSMALLVQVSMQCCSVLYDLSGVCCWVVRMHVMVGGPNAWWYVVQYVQ